MADNVTIPATGSGEATPKVAADEAPYSGDTAKIQLLRLVHVTGAEGAKTISEIVKNAAPSASDYGAVVRIPEPATGTLTQPAQSALTAVLLATNANRRWALIENDPDGGVADLYIALAATTTTVAYSRKLKPGEFWRIDNYTGVISGLWSAAGTGAAKVTEVT